MLHAANISHIDQIVVHDFHCPIPDVVRSLHPQELILSLELFCHKDFSITSQMS